MPQKIEELNLLLLFRKFEFRNSCFGFGSYQAWNFHFLAVFFALKAFTKEE